MNHLSSNPFDPQDWGRTAEQWAETPEIAQLIRDRGILIYLSIYLSSANVY